MVKYCPKRHAANKNANAKDSVFPPSFRSSNPYIKTTLLTQKHHPYRAFAQKVVH
jgi:hypothetical protein